jgi:tetratricopeptide (TPR) repeat protein
MASLIPGYEYDIFISYRQKDNKYDGWVTEFVNNLKRELEATFKEEISVYFDINPHDGLLETHDVDASLKDKLKCLVFIPIISRTYCDPKSFAWEHEFKAFVDLASQDKFGLRVKLPNGNVANRVLPVRIHDLDHEDIKLCESVLGGVLRGVEFIYKEPGVNRSLTKDDDEKKNLNNTRYRNQINKVALAIKELILGLKAVSGLSSTEDIRQKPVKGEVDHKWEKEGKGKSFKLNRSKLLSGVLITAVILGAVIIVYPKIFKRDTLEKSISSANRISVAVMPFQNMTNDTIWDWWQNGIQENLVTYLSDFPEYLKVRQTESVNSILISKNLTSYASITPIISKTISQKLDASLFISGSIQKAGTKLRINAKIVDTETEEVIKPFEIEGIYNQDSIFVITDSLRKMVTDFLIISKLKKRENRELQTYTYTGSPEAYKYFIYGANAGRMGDYRTALNMHSQAVKIDSNFIAASVFLAFQYNNIGQYLEAKKLCLKVYKKKDQLPMTVQIIINWTYSLLFGTPPEQIKYLKQSLEIDDQQPSVYYLIGETYLQGLNNYVKAIPEFEKALDLYKKWEIKPGPATYTSLGLAYHETGQYRKERKTYKKAEKDFPDNLYIIFGQAVLALSEGDTGGANRYIEKFKSVLKDNSASEAVIATSLANIYAGANILDKAEEYFRKALSLEPENLDRKLYLAYFLIDKNININEGLELAERVLILRPYGYRALDCKGWGLYKQGKYKEAEEILQKSWDLRREKAVYYYEAFLHLEVAKKAVAGLK